MTIEYTFNGERFDYDADDGEIQEAIEEYIELFVTFKNKFGKGLVLDIFELASNDDNFIDDLVNKNDDLMNMLTERFSERAIEKWQSIANGNIEKSFASSLNRRYLGR